MPQRRSGIKELRKNYKNKMHNLDIKTDLKKTVKLYKKAIGQNDIDEAKTQLNVVYKKLDKATKRNILHKNTAARRKANLSKMLNAKTDQKSIPSQSDE